MTLMNAAVPEVPARFNLVDDAWISVRFVDGDSREVSIRDAFHRARDIREVRGDLPTQSFAILRLLLAILYRAAGAPFTKQTWAVWHRDGLPLDRVERYLNVFRDRFELLDPERPFFQVAELTTAKGQWKDVGPLIADLPNNNRLFTNRAGKGASDLPLAEAARWLVTAQAFDVAGIKSGAVGDPRVKGGKGYPIGVAWTGLLGGVYVQGADLFDTLMLNLVGHDHLPGVEYGDDIPPWEEHEPDDAAERPGLVPRGPVRLYTWQSRRIRLLAAGDRIVGCLVANGDQLTPQNMQSLEPMSAWRFSEPQTKKSKQNTYMPKEHAPGRALWRGVGALLPGIAPIVPKRDVDSNHPPALIDWLAGLDTSGLVDPGMRLRLRSVGVVYGSNNSVVDEILADEVLLPIVLLRERNRPLARQAEDAVHLADEGVYAVRRLAENLERAAGGTGEASKDAAVETAYAALDVPYRRWLQEIAADDVDAIQARNAWKQTAREVLLGVGAELIAAAGPAAWVGREVSRLGQTELITTPRAEGWFLRSILKIFGKPIRKDEAS